MASGPEPANGSVGIELPGRTYRDGGFTLLELLVTLAVLGFALVLVVGYKPPWSHTLGLTAAAGEIAQALRAARSDAIVGNRPVAFEIDLAKRQFSINAGAVRQLPPQLTISLLTVADERRDPQRGGILFNPDGSSTGGRIALADGGAMVVLAVDWLTGRISLADAP